MKGFVRPALLTAGAVMLAACSMFDHSQPTPAPQPAHQSVYSGDQQRQPGMMGPAPTAQNRE